MARALFGEKSPYKLIVAVTVTVVACALLILFLGTRLGLSIRATGDNPDMVRASSINTAAKQRFANNQRSQTDDHHASAQVDIGGFLVSSFCACRIKRGHSVIKYGGIKNGQTEKIIAVIGFNSNIDFGIDILRI